MDKRKFNGGHKNSGRKPKAEEQKLIEKLTPLEPLAYDALSRALILAEGWAVKLYFEYKYGKPRQQMDITSGGEKIDISPMTFIDLNED